METKCIIIGDCSLNKKRFPIKFVKYLNPSPDPDINYRPSQIPKDYQVIELIQSGVRFDRYDVMLAYNNDRESGHLWLGRWNDGIVK